MDDPLVSLETEEQFREVFALQKEIWNFEDRDLLPVRFFVVARSVGGDTLAAYEGTKMIAFCLGIPGFKAGLKPYIHSHMLGVKQGYRDRGLGRLLKLRQKQDALARGIELIEWTFDPLEIRNAYFNVEVLGATVKRYVRNQYGASTSPLQGGLPTDRCTAEWWISRPRLQTPVIERITVPSNIAYLRLEDPAAARAAQAHIAGQFEACFARGLAVTGVDRAGAYLLGMPHEN